MHPGEITNLHEAYLAKYYDSTIAAVKAVAGYDAEYDHYDKPTNASNLGALIQKNRRGVDKLMHKRRQA